MESIGQRDWLWRLGRGWGLENETQSFLKKKLKTAEFFSLSVLTGYRAYEDSPGLQPFLAES